MVLLHHRAVEGSVVAVHPPPPPLTFAAAAAAADAAAAASTAAAAVTTNTTTTTAPLPPPPPHDAPSPGAQQLRLSGDDNGTAIVVGLTLAAVGLLFAFLAARKYRQERRIRETVRMQQLLQQHQQAMHGGGGGDGISNDEVRSTITQNVRREIAGTASNASSTISPGRPLGGVRRGRSKTMRTPSVTSQRTLTLPSPAASSSNNNTIFGHGSLSFSSEHMGDLL